MSVVNAKAQLNSRELALLESEMRARSKSTLVAYVLWFFLGMLGGHRFYLGGRRGWLFVLAFIVGLLTSVVLIGLFILLIEFIVVIIDAFRLPGFVDETNRAIENQVITEILAARASTASQGGAAGSQE